RMWSDELATGWDRSCKAVSLISGSVVARPIVHTRWVASTRVRVSGLDTFSRSEISSAICPTVRGLAFPCAALTPAWAKPAQAGDPIAAVLKSVNRPNTDRAFFMPFSLGLGVGWLKPAVRLRALHVRHCQWLQSGGQCTASQLHLNRSSFT